MNSTPLIIWCNVLLPEPAMAELTARVKRHRLVFPTDLQRSNLAVGGADPLLGDADVAFGQPDAVQTMDLPKLKWVHLTTAGYTRYDRDDLREAFRRRDAILTNSSSVYSEPCAEHVFAMMLGLARQLPQSIAEQFGPRDWQTAKHRENSRLLVGQRVLILGFGAIASRLVELLQPFRMDITATRRRPTGNEPCRVVESEKTDELLPLADHVVNILPANATTDQFLNRRRLALMKPGAIFYNIGRGTTVEQTALVEAMQNRKLAAAYLDVTDPEPLRPGHPLWTAPNCYITPHTAGGHSDEFERLVRHFADNLDRYMENKELSDRVF